MNHRRWMKFNLRIDESVPNPMSKLKIHKPHYFGVFSLISFRVQMFHSFKFHFVWPKWKKMFKVEHRPQVRVCQKERNWRPKWIRDVSHLAGQRHRPWNSMGPHRAQADESCPRWACNVYISTCYLMNGRELCPNTQGIVTFNCNFHWLDCTFRCLFKWPVEYFLSIKHQSIARELLCWKSFGLDLNRVVF